MGSCHKVIILTLLDSPIVIPAKNTMAALRTLKAKLM